MLVGGILGDWEGRDGRLVLFWGMEISGISDLRFTSHFLLVGNYSLGEGAGSSENIEDACFHLSYDGTVTCLGT